MSFIRRRPVRAALAATLSAALVGLAAPAVPAAPGTAVTPRTADPAGQLLAWERIAFGTVYPTGSPPPYTPLPIPVGVPVLGYTSTAMYDAVELSLQRGRSSETAALAAAAHDVLGAYVPAAKPALHDHLTATLALVDDERARAKGLRLGHRAAAALLAERADDGFGDTSIHYTLPPGIGVWQPTPPATDMLAAWIGSMRPLLVETPVVYDGPDPVSSAAYADDYAEVAALGSATSTARSADQTATALFFNSNSATMVGDALVRRLEQQPLGIRRTAWIFAAMHTAMTDSLITCWRLKRDVGFWRPSQAIAAAATDGNAATAPVPGWTPLVGNPPYSDYVSGHACLTAPAVQVVRRTLGETYPLELRSVNFPGQPRTYPTLTMLEDQAFHARIWSGLHFRDAMVDGYAIGHATADRVMAELE